jgi:glucosamine--fructose-6-phosphate aminotransferase (isomerizing)
MEQPEAISRALNYGGRFKEDGSVKLGGLDENKDMLLGIKHLVMAACGTSYYASLYGSLLMRSLKCFDTVYAVDAAEVTADTFPMHKGGCLLVSQSGETKDTHRSLQVAENLLVPNFSIVNQVGSLIARSTNCGVYLNAGREHAVASTKAFTTQVTAMALVSGWYSQNRTTTEDHNAIKYNQKRSELIESIQRLPIYAGMTLRTRDKCKEIAAKLKDKQHIFILGKGYAEPIAYESALKLKEITYIHAEGYSGGALKHGPFALLETGTPVIMFILTDQHQELMRIAAQETRARGAHNIIITDNPKLAEGLAAPEDVISIPANGPMTALLGVIPLQLLAYELALKKGINPDKPKNLAKAVTVD